MALALSHSVGVEERSRAKKLHYAGLATGSVVSATVVASLAAVALLLREAGVWAEPLVLALGSALFGAWAVRVATGRGLPYPKPRWQVPDAWRYSLPPGFTMGAYGFLLGLGVTTNPILPAIWILVALSIWLGGLGGIVGAWLVYAATRAATTERATRRAVEHARTVGTGDPDFLVDLNSRRLLLFARVATVTILVCLSIAAGHTAVTA